MSRYRHAALLLCLALGALSACASQHGTLSSLSAARSADAAFCEHKVPKEACTRCNPTLIPKFKTAGDWCAEHAVPESQCFTCHPDLTFEPLPEPPSGADVKRLAEAGEDIGPLDAHAVRGKVTVFDFYADWCTPCRKIDAHVFGLLRSNTDLAYRRLNLVSWESPLARHQLTNVPNLPYVRVYGRDGKPAGEVSGLDLATLDRLIEAARRR